MPTSIPRGCGFVAEFSPAAMSPFDELPDGWEDMSLAPKWRTFADPSERGCPVGHVRHEGQRLIWCVTPGEWTVLGPPPDNVAIVDLGHVRAAFRIPAAEAARLLPSVCALDLDDRMFPDGAAARTDVAGVATEILRDPSAFLLVMSRSYARYLAGVLG